MKIDDKDPRTYTVIARDGVIYINSLLISKMLNESHDSTLERVLNARREWLRETPQWYSPEARAELNKHFAYEMLLFLNNIAIETFNLTEEALLYLELPFEAESKILGLFDRHRESFPDHR